MKLRAELPALITSGGFSSPSRAFNLYGLNLAFEFRLRLRRALCAGFDPGLMDKSTSAARREDSGDSGHSPNIARPHSFSAFPARRTLSLALAMWLHRPCHPVNAGFPRW